MKELALPFMFLIPLIGGFGLTLIRSTNDNVIKWTSFLISMVVLGLNLWVVFNFDFASGEEWQFAYTYEWIKSLNVNLRFGVDVISLYLCMLTSFIMPLAILGSFNSVKTRTREFYIWLLVLQAAMLGVFIARDIIFFYICFEMTLIPMYFLIGIFGGAQKKWACQKFFIFTLAGSVFTFVGILYVAYFNSTLAEGLHAASGTFSFNIETLVYAGSLMPPFAQGLVLLALMLGFAVKVPLFPVHTWLPLAHTEAPTAGSVILAGVLLKLGSYGLLRFALPMVPDAVVSYAWIVAVLSIIGIIYTALICWVQDDVKKLVAYSSVSHMGFCILGMFALTVTGVGGSVMYMINHGLSTGALFLCIGMIYERYHTRDMNELSGIGRVMPVWGTFMVFFCMASVGLPGLNGFVGEFLTVLGTYESEVLGISYAAVAGFGMILAAVYILYMVGKVVLGPVKVPEAYANAKDLNLREIVTLTPFAVLCLILGILPTPLLKGMETSVEKILAPTQQVIAEQKAAEAKMKTAGEVELPVTVEVSQEVAR